LRLKRDVQKTIYSRKHQQFCEMLKQARKSKGLTQTELAQRLGTRQQWVAKVESGERRLDVIEFSEIAPALGLNVTKFLRELA